MSIIHKGDPLIPTTIDIISQLPDELIAEIAAKSNPQSLISLSKTSNTIRSKTKLNIDMINAINRSENIKGPIMEVCNTSEIKKCKFLNNIRLFLQNSNVYGNSYYQITYNTDTDGIYYYYGKFLRLGDKQYPYGDFKFIIIKKNFEYLIISGKSFINKRIVPILDSTKLIERGFISEDNQNYNIINEYMRGNINLEVQILDTLRFDNFYLSPINTAEYSTFHDKVLIFQEINIISMIKHMGSSVQGYDINTSELENGSPRTTNLSSIDLIRDSSLEDLDTRQRCMMQINRYEILYSYTNNNFVLIYKHISTGNNIVCTTEQQKLLAPIGIENVNPILYIKIDIPVDENNQVEYSSFENFNIDTSIDRVKELIGEKSIINNNDIEIKDVIDEQLQTYRKYEDSLILDHDTKIKYAETYKLLTTRFIKDGITLRGNFYLQNVSWMRSYLIFSIESGYYHIESEFIYLFAGDNLILPSNPQLANLNPDLGGNNETSDGIVSYLKEYVLSDDNINKLPLYKRQNDIYHVINFLEMKGIFISFNKSIFSQYDRNLQQNTININYNGDKISIILAYENGILINMNLECDERYT